MQNFIYKHREMELKNDSSFLNMLKTALQENQYKPIVCLD